MVHYRNIRIVRGRVGRCFLVVWVSILHQCALLAALLLSVWVLSSWLAMMSNLCRLCLDIWVGGTLSTRPKLGVLPNRALWFLVRCNLMESRGRCIDIHEHKLIIIPWLNMTGFVLCLFLSSLLFIKRKLASIYLSDAFLTVLLFLTPRWTLPRSISPTSCSLAKLLAKA